MPHHPLSYASQALSPTEKNYPVMELETLAVVWAVSHYRAYLYSHNVTVYTEHSAVKAVLGATDLRGKYVRWWTKVYANGVRTIEIVYCSGEENSNADALSRIPLSCPEQAIPQEGEPVCEVLAVQCEDH